ncbi:hypothetical protein IMCC3135_01830 [Granulosicoccus antarcticus IMCC3135]|uniref:Lipoprotein n=2 Tax=Granulosicoccus TaxID=437504 RepID=A0A2Z2NJ15_9GAMM|nr:hypothetical protein IMCC3135_01830 [Granulosicoccus antarcticus IMCC3135]
MTAMFNMPMAKILSAALLLSMSACSTFSKDKPEDTQALTSYPTPDLSGQWEDADYPALAITLNQSDASFSFTRKGFHGGIQVDETHNGDLKGRSASSTYLGRDGGARPIKGRCFGTVDKESTKIALTCEDIKKGTYPLTLQKL